MGPIEPAGPPVIPWFAYPEANTIGTVRPEFVFVLEQSLGGGVYGARLERSVAADRRVSSTFIQVAPTHSGPTRHIPGLANHTLQTSWQTRSALRRRPRGTPIDALFIHTQCASLLARDMIRTVPTVISMDATPANYDRLGAAYHHRRQGWLAESVKLRIYQALFGTAAALITWSWWAAESLVNDYGVAAEKVHVIRPGVDLSRFSPRPRRLEGPVRVLFVGGDLVRKGGTDLLEAMALIGDRAECDLVTTAAPRHIPRGARVRVHQGIAADSPELIELYRRADIFALPTRGECYGHVIVEAMACALPVVTCPVGAVPELVSDGDNGLLVPPASPEALAVALGTLIDHPELRHVIGSRNLEKAWAEHDELRSHSSVVEVMTKVARRDERVRAGTAVA